MKRRSPRELPTDAPPRDGPIEQPEADGQGAPGLVPDRPDLDADDDVQLLAQARRRLRRDNPDLLRITRQIAARLAQQG